MAVVSVILPSCNSELWIVDSVKSVLEQTHKSLELIVVDDGSTYINAPIFKMLF